MPGDPGNWLCAHSWNISCADFYLSVYHVFDSFILEGRTTNIREHDIFKPILVSSLLKPSMLVDLDHPCERSEVWAAILRAHKVASYYLVVNTSTIAPASCARQHQGVQCTRRRTTLAQNCPTIVAYNDEPESSCSAILSNGYLRLGNWYIFGIHSSRLTIWFPRQLSELYMLWIWNVSLQPENRCLVWAWEFQGQNEKLCAHVLATISEFEGSLFAR